MGLSRPRLKSGGHTTDSSDPQRNTNHDSWGVDHLVALAATGSLAAARELMHRVLRHCEHTSRVRPDLFQPALLLWLKPFFNRVVDDPRRPAVDLMAGPRPQHGTGKRVTPMSHAELVHAMSLAEEAYLRVQQGVDDGLPLRSVLNAVTNELNALGYRNRRNEPLTVTLVRERYYRVRQSRGRAVWRRRN